MFLSLLRFWSITVILGSISIKLARQIIWDRRYKFYSNYFKQRSLIVPTKFNYEILNIKHKYKTANIKVLHRLHYPQRTWLNYPAVTYVAITLRRPWCLIFDSHTKLSSHSHTKFKSKRKSAKDTQSLQSWIVWDFVHYFSILHQMIALNNYEKRFLFHIGSPFCSCDIQFVVLQSSFIFPLAKTMVEGES